MSLVDDDRIRREFRTFVGEERFTHWAVFAASGLPANGLEAHMQRVWDAFRVAHPEAPSAQKDIRRILLWCVVHERPILDNQLQRPFFDVFTRSAVTHERRTSAWYEAASVGFPHGHGGIHTICPDCVNAHLAWLRTHPTWLRGEPEDSGES